MRHTLLSLVVAFGLIHPAAAQDAKHLPGTAPLTEKADFARKMLEGLDRWLDKQTAATAAERGKNFKPDFSSAEAYEKSLEPKREKLKKLLGVIDTRVSPTAFEGVAVPSKPAMVAETGFIKAYAVRWPVLPGVTGVTGEGLLLEPRGTPVANVVALPDAEMTPEQIAGMDKGKTPPICGRFALRLAENGCRVLVPTLIDRNDTWSGSPSLGRMTNQSHREFVQRMAWEMGRTITGYELQRIFAGFDAMEATAPKLPRGLYGYGEGGRLAMYAAAIDPRIKATVVSGEFGPRENLHEEPIDRSVWSVLREFGPAELEQMIAPRSLTIETAEFKPAPLPAVRAGRGGAAPGTLRAPTAAEIDAEHKRLASLMTAAKDFPAPRVVPLEVADAQAVRELRNVLGPKIGFVDSEKPTAIAVNVEARQKRQFDELVDYTQKRMPEAVQKRKQHVWDRLDVKSPEAFVKSQEPVRASFLNDIVGNMPEPNKDMKPRTRLILETPKWKGYEVVLDIFDDVISYGILLVPNDLKPGEKRPCVVCQHGLEGRPMDVVDPTKKTPYYNSFGAQLADKGYVVFAPQAPYIFKNDFRQVVRKMHPLGYNLYAIIVRQHQQVLNFLGTLDFVDSSRIAYYGLSYGGKVAMRIPSLVLGYCAVICSGDFNEWIWKNINLDWVGSYMFTGEYDMYEFNLGNTFNYAEMSALIAPRPFMVERGHDDGVGLDEYVAFEYAKTRRLYSRLKMPERTEIEFFPGGHECRCVGTFAFLSKHLNWPN